MSYNEIIKAEKVLVDRLHRANENGCNAIEWTKQINNIIKIRKMFIYL